MIITFFSTARVTVPDPHEVSWAELKTLLTTHRYDYPGKDAVPAFSPAEYPKGTQRRQKQNVLAIHFGVLDLDKLDDQQTEVVLQAANDVAHIVYSTWSHAARLPLWNFRLVVPFSRPVLPSEWELFWPRFNQRFGAVADPKCRDSSHIYFFPAAPKGTEEHAFAEAHEGPFLDVDDLLNAPLNFQQGSGEKLSDEDLDGFAVSLKRRQQGFYKRMGRCLTNILKHEAFAEKGERDETIFQLTGLIVVQWPNLDARHLAEKFGPSLEKMAKQAPQCPTVDDVEKKIQRHKEQVLQEEEKVDQERLADRDRNIQQAFANGRKHPYSSEELNKFAREAGVSREAFMKRWIIQKGRTYYIFFNGSYLKPTTDADLQTAAQRDLAAADSAGVKLWKVGQRGEPTFKSAQELMRDYGTVASEIVVDMNAQRSIYDDKTRTLVEAPCPLRDLKAQFDPDVDEWLTWLGADKYEKLVDWIATVTTLDEPTAALYLYGYPGAGKTLLADGLARLWSQEKPTPLEEVMANFNDTLMACPLVLADETVPKDSRGRVKTAELRQAIQARIRPLKRKFFPTATLRGSIRLIITANNDELLLSNEALTANDIQAIHERIIGINCAKNVARFLKTVDTRSFVKDDRIARHALWLVENRQIASGSRFLVEGTDSALHRTLTTSAGLRSVVCNWLVSYLLNPVKLDSLGHLLVRRWNQKLLATARGLAEFWDVYKTNEPAPSAGRISQALSGLSESKIQLKDGEDRRTHYWVIDSQNLVTWAEKNGYATEEILISAIEKPQEIEVSLHLN